MKSRSRVLGPRLRVFLQPDFAIGPGKAEILQGIRDTGSIAAAGRRMGMSYKRAWRLVETMNRCFRSPIVVTSKGGSTHGGARLTPAGEELLQRYRRMETLTAGAIEPEMKALRLLLVEPAGRSNR